MLYIILYGTLDLQYIYLTYIYNVIDGTSTYLTNVLWILRCKIHVNVASAMSVYDFYCGHLTVQPQCKASDVAK